MLRTGKKSESVKGAWKSACVSGLVVCAAVLGHSSFAAAQSLTDILARTYEANGDIAAAWSELKSVTETLPIAQSGFMPDLEFTATEGRSRIRQSTKDAFKTGGTTTNLLETTTDRSIELEFTLNLYDGGETSAKVSAAEAGIAAQIYAMSVTEQDTLESAATYYGEALEYALLLKYSKQNLQDLLKLLEQAEYLFARQQITITDVSQVKAEVASARSTIAEYRGYLISSLSSLRGVAGADAIASTNVFAASEWPALPVPTQTLEEAQAIGEKENPSILEYQYLVKEQDADIRTYEGALLPDLDFYNTVTREWDSSTYTGSSDYKEHTREDTWSIGATVTVPLYSGGENFAYIRQAKQNALEARNTLRSTQDTVRGEIASNWALVVASREMLKNANEEINAWQTAVDGFQRQFQAGTSTMQSILTAKTDLYDAQVEQVTAQYDLFSATVSLLTSMGRFNAVHLNLPVKAFNAHAVVERARYRFFGLSSN